ncbi:hypothetical protein B0I37DRAFT_333459 [Chaetomium sp. MPI-CAGE-AT-0009]|nr:hypothetical protein B0I37DRAFT_333459 [Chaetomium sp. MPI-CAGE-AT-0009]
MGTLVPPWYKEKPTSESGLLVAAFFFGASMTIAALDSTKAARQSARSWRRNHRANAYVIMIWTVIAVCIVISVCSWLYLLAIIPPSIWYFLGILVMWTIQLQCLMQILANRLTLIMYDPVKERRLKQGLFILIGLINVSVFCLWVPARLQISPTFIHANEIWDRIEKGLFALVDMAMNGYFMWLVKSKLVSSGLTKYNLVYKYNLVMACVSVSLDILLIGIMWFPDDTIYVQVHPLVYLVKLRIEMSMAELVGKVAKMSQQLDSSQPMTDIWQPRLGMDALGGQWLGVPSQRRASEITGTGHAGCGKERMRQVERLEEKYTMPGFPRGKSSSSSSPRSSTKGPLDDDGPLASPLSADQVQQTLSLRSHPRSPALGSPMMPRSPAHSPAPTGNRVAVGGAPPSKQGPKDFSYLLRPEIYHPLTPLNIPPPFRNPPNPPAPDTPIPDLLSQGYFRAAAIAATQALTSGTLDPTDHVRIFDLLYTRLACLTLIDATALAAQEVKALGDLHSAFYYTSPATQQHQQQQPPQTPGTPSPQPQADQTHPTSTTTSAPTHVVPWPLRLLAVRLQALGFGDPRRAVMSYYELAREARARVAAARAAHDHSAAEAWKHRLADLGVRVAGALVEMDDLVGAVAHLGTLGLGGEGVAGGGDGGEGGMGMVRVRRALLWLHLGDVDAARACVGEGGATGGVEERVVTSLCDMADGEYEAALGKWAQLKELVDDEMVGVNMAVCLLYVGKMHEGRELLEQLVDSGRTSHTLLFNLSTMYELCTDRSRALKVALSEKVAAMTDRMEGWEKSNADFKL